MNIYTNLQDAIRSVALKANSEFPTMPVIFSHQNGSEPSETYLVINILNFEQIGRHSTPQLTDAQEYLDIRVLYECMVQFSFVGSLSGDASHSFAQRINSIPAVLEENSRQKLGFLRKTPIRRAPQKRETQWIEGFNLDCTYNYIINTREKVDVVEHVVLEDYYTGDQCTLPPIEAQPLFTEDGQSITTESGDVLTTEGGN